MYIFMKRLNKSCGFFQHSDQSKSERLEQKICPDSVFSRGSMYKNHAISISYYLGSKRFYMIRRLPIKEDA